MMWEANDLDRKAISFCHLSMKLKTDRPRRNWTEIKSKKNHIVDDDCPSSIVGHQNASQIRRNISLKIAWIFRTNVEILLTTEKK